MRSAKNDGAADLTTFHRSRFNLLFNAAPLSLLLLILSLLFCVKDFIEGIAVAKGFVLVNWYCATAADVAASILLTLFALLIVLSFAREVSYVALLTSSCNYAS